jgi:hypothetical protein
MIDKNNGSLSTQNNRSKQHEQTIEIRAAPSLPTMQFCVLSKIRIFSESSLVQKHLL